MVLLSVVMLLSSQATAFAYTDTGAETAVTEEAESAKESETEKVLEDNHSDDTFSVAGNGEVLDDISNDSSKEFLTITTKNNTFYIVIDRSTTTDNVYMLSQIDENDLKEFIDSETQEETPGATVVLEETQPEDTAEVVVEETKEEPEVTANTGGMLAILAVAAVGVAGYYFLKFRKDNQDDDDSQNEGMENPGTEAEEKTVNEDEEAAQQAEKEKKESK